MKKIFKLIIKLFTLLAIVGIIIVSVYINEGYNMYTEAISQKSILMMIEELEAKENYVKIQDVPKIYQNAVIAVEDHRFYKHKGVDLLSIARAIFKNVKNADLIEGGSTITQQVCKNVYFTQSRKLERKFAEIFMSIELEKNCNKDKILEIYFNTCFYGNGYYTLAEASRGYFNKEPMELTDYESTMIAGIPNAPSLYNPVKSLELAKQRQKQVLNAMKKYNYLTEEEVKKILDEDIDLTRFEN